MAIANTSAVAAAYELDVRTLAAADATLVATETKVQADLTQISTARQLATSAASRQQASLVALTAGNDPTAPGYLAAQSAGGSAVLADKTSAALPPAISAAIWAAALEIGVPYVWGGETPLPDPSAGFDCSGLVQWAYGKAGISLPRTAQDQYNAVDPGTRRGGPNPVTSCSGTTAPRRCSTWPSTSARGSCSRPRARGRWSATHPCGPRAWWDSAPPSSPL